MKFLALLSCLILFAAVSSFAQTETQSSPRDESLRIVGAVEYDGFDRLDAESDGREKKRIFESDFLLALRGQGAAIRVGDTLHAENVEKASNLIKEWIASNGYAQAKVTVDVTELPEDRVKLRFSINRGPIARVTEIRFTGNKNISGDEFLHNFKTCLGDDPDVYDARKYDYCAQKSSRSLMYSNGYFGGKISGITTNRIDESLHVTIAVEEGFRYRWGKIKIEGAVAFSDKRILSMFGQQTGEIANGKALQDFVYEKLKERYDALGYAAYNAEFEPSFTDPRDGKLDGAVDVLITIDEGLRFTVRRIRFAGVDDKEGELLLREFLVRSGEIFSGRKLQDAVDKFNELGRFEIIDKDQDVEILTDEEGGDVDLVIALRKPHS